MKKVNSRDLDDDLRPEYDLSQLTGVRGKYAKKFQAGTNLVLLTPDVARFFSGRECSQCRVEIVNRYSENPTAPRSLKGFQGTGSLKGFTGQVL